MSADDVLDVVFLALAVIVWTLVAISIYLVVKYLPIAMGRPELTSGSAPLTWRQILGKLWRWARRAGRAAP